jgi:hypothetical protein
MHQPSSPTSAPNIHEKESATVDHEVAMRPDRQAIEPGKDQREDRHIDPTASRASRTDSSVIGRPFALSASLKAEMSKDEAFRPARESLEQVARESRDAEWANAGESQIQALMEGRYSIRNIECRATICAVEVEVPSQRESFDIITIQQGLVKVGLYGPGYLTRAHEADVDVAFFTVLRR